MRHLFLMILAVLILPFAAVQAQDIDMRAGIAAVVNDDIVSYEDVARRMRLIMSSSQMPNNAAVRNRLLPQVLNMLIVESVQLQRAQELNIEVQESDVEQRLARIAQGNAMVYNDFITMLKERGLDVDSLREQVRAEIAWARITQISLRSEINISDADIDAVIERLKNSVGEPEYLVSEIFLPIDEGSNDREVADLADDLVVQIRNKKAGFQALAQQFSASASAARGGDIGWVMSDELADDLGFYLSEIENGDVSDPLRTMRGYHVFWVRDKRVVMEDGELPTREEIYEQIGQERLDRLQQRRLQELRKAAFIERRV